MYPRLSELIGSSIAGKLHTGRSRNDQIATDMRLWAREQLSELEQLLKSTLQVCAAKAKSNLSALMPGYTHLQRAQPIRFSHWLLSHANFLVNDLHRLKGVRERVDSCPVRRHSRPPSIDFLLTKSSWELALLLEIRMALIDNSLPTIWCVRLLLPCFVKHETV